MHISLLSRRSSPIAIASNLFRRDWITRLYYRPDISYGTKIGRDKEKIKTKVVFKLLLLLLVAPIVNIFTIFMALRTEKELTFGEAGFGGISIKFANASAETGASEADNCIVLPVEIRQGDEQPSEFVTCAQIITTKATDETGNQATVTMFLWKNSSIRLFIEFQKTRVFLTKDLTLFSNNTLYAVVSHFSEKEAEDVVDYGIALLSSACGSSLLLPRSLEDSPVKILLSKSIPCSGMDNVEMQLKTILSHIHKRFVVFQGNRELKVFPLSPVSQEQNSKTRILDARNLKFISRRRKRMSSLLLLLLSAVIIFLRGIGSMFFHEDVDIGLERIVKIRLGLNCCSSLIAEGSRSIQYNGMYEKGSIAHYGLHCSDLDNVTKFKNGSLIGTCSEERFSETLEDICGKKPQGSGISKVIPTNQE